MVIQMTSTTKFEPRQFVAVILGAGVLWVLTMSFSAGLALFAATSLWIGIIEQRLFKRAK